MEMRASWPSCLTRYRHRTLKRRRGRRCAPMGGYVGDELTHVLVAKGGARVTPGVRSSPFVSHVNVMPTNR